MTSLNYNVKIMRKVSLQILVEVVCVKFHSIVPVVRKWIAVADTQSDQYTLRQEGFIPSVNIFNNEMT